MNRVVVLPSGAQVRGRRMSDPPDPAADYPLALADGPLPPCRVRRDAWPDFSDPDPSR